MRAEERRKEIALALMSEQKPLSGGVLADRFGVSRQIIVQDISLLKAVGYGILSTHSGYMLQSSPLAERVFKVKHTTDQTEDELTNIVDLGGTVADVFVWHKAYGKVQVDLNISSRLHVRRFIEAVRTGKSTELMNITGGYHYHTVRAENEETLDRIGRFLSDRNYIAPII